MSNRHRNTLPLTAVHRHCRHQQNYHHFSSNPKPRKSPTAAWCAWGVKWSVRQNVTSGVWVGRQLRKPPFCSPTIFLIDSIQLLPLSQETHVTAMMSLMYPSNFTSVLYKPASQHLSRYSFKCVNRLCQTAVFRGSLFSNKTLYLRFRLFCKQSAHLSWSNRTFEQFFTLRLSADTVKRKSRDVLDYVCWTRLICNPSSPFASHCRNLSRFVIKRKPVLSLT